MDNAAKNSIKAKDAYPVFRGLTELGVSERDMADAMATSQAQITAWRRGSARMPAHLVAFMTEFLDRLVEIKRAEVSYMAPLAADTDMSERARITQAIDGLQQQRAFNRAFPGRETQDGLRLFKRWRRRKVAAEQACQAPLRLSAQPSI